MTSFVRHFLCLRQFKSHSCSKFREYKEEQFLMMSCEVTKKNTNDTKCKATRVPAFLFRFYEFPREVVATSERYHLENPEPGRAALESIEGILLFPVNVLEVALTLPTIIAIGPRSRGTRPYKEIRELRAMKAKATDSHWGQTFSVSAEGLNSLENRIQKQIQVQNQIHAEKF